MKLAGAPPLPSLAARFPPLGFLPFLGLPFALRGLPLGDGAGPLPWPDALLHSGILAGLMLAHTACYARWHARDPRRIMLNEGLARAWFVLYGLLVVSTLGPHGVWYLALASPWAALTWLVHADQVRKEGYRWPTGLAILGLFLVGLTLVGLLTVRPTTFGG